MCTKMMEQPFYPDSFFSGYSQEYKAAASLKSSMALNLSAEPPSSSSSSFRGLKSQLGHHHQPPQHHHHHPSHHDGGGGGGYYPGSLHPQPPETGNSSSSPSSSSSLKLAAPELERLISSSSHGVITTTTPTPPGQYFYPRGPTEEQEGFVKGFVKALDDLHKLNHLPPPNVSLGAAVAATATAANSPPSSGGYGSSSASSSLPQEPPPVYTNLTSYNPAPQGRHSPGFPSANLSYLPQHPAPAPPSAAGLLGLASSSSSSSRGFKEEPQTVPDVVQSPPVSPINMEDQERIKVERKRLRNRLAATKCRKRKLERIARLEEKVKSLKSDNAGLSSAASALRDQVAQLKQKVMSHVNSGCQLLLTAKMQQSF